MLQESKSFPRIDPPMGGQCNRAWDARYSPHAFDEDPEDLFLKRDKWSVAWSDLMMTMFVLFCVLYIYKVGNRDVLTQIDPDSRLSDSGGQVVDMTLFNNPVDIYDYFKATVMEQFVDGTVQAEVMADGAVLISIAGDILFDTGKAELKEKARAQLMEIARFLRQNRYLINVVGHTDSLPNHSAQYPTNWELSAARACRTVRFFVEQAGLSADRFFLSAHADHQPVAPNNNSHNRRLNRRVDIVLLKNRPYMTPLTQG